MKKLTTLILTIPFLSFGCTSPPTNIGKYHLDDNARHVIHTYATQVLRRDFERAAEHVFGLVNADRNHTINDDEAYEAIQLMKPHAKEFYKTLMAIKPKETKDAEVVKSQKTN